MEYKLEFNRYSKELSEVFYRIIYKSNNGGEKLYFIKFSDGDIFLMSNLKVKKGKKFFKEYYCNKSLYISHYNFYYYNNVQRFFLENLEVESNIDNLDSWKTHETKQRKEIVCCQINSSFLDIIMKRFNEIFFNYYNSSCPKSNHTYKELDYFFRFFKSQLIYTFLA